VVEGSAFGHVGHDRPFHPIGVGRSERVLLELLDLLFFAHHSADAVAGR